MLSCQHLFGLLAWQVEPHRNDFKIQMVPYSDISSAHSHFGFSKIDILVNGILDKVSIWFGDPMNELFYAMKVPLTNSSEYLAGESSISIRDQYFYAE
ncbi:MAG: hypothetical protein ACL7AX_01640 [Candidatus Arsenophonus phytopathogenicus]